jgi:hypothetical protein
MKHNSKKLKFALLGLFLAMGLLFSQNLIPRAEAQNTPNVRNIFGGKIEVKRWRFCLIPVPFFPFIIPYPFIYLEVGVPTPAKLYYLYGIPGTPLDSQLFREFEMEETAWSTGNFWPELDDVFRDSLRCLNRSALPQADGVIKYIGTSCKTQRDNGDQYDPRVNSPQGEGIECRPQAEGQQGGGNNTFNPASLIAPIFSVIVPAVIDPNSPKQNEYTTYCTPTSPAGSCVAYQPTVDIKANGADGPITINPGDSATISWTSTYAVSCSVSPTGWTGTFNLGWPTGALTANQTYTVTCTDITTYQTATDSVTVNVVAPTTNPTALFTANGSHSITVNAGGNVSYAWSSSNANAYSSLITSITPGGTDACGNTAGNAWVATTASGSLSANTASCQAGSTYTITYTATDTNTGTSASDSVTITVSGAAGNSPTAVFEVSADGVNYSHSITVNVGATVWYRWSSTNTSSYSSQTVNGSWSAIESSGGLITRVIIASQAGGSFPVTYTATNSTSGQSTSDSATIRVNP